jgi:hypothetical protein
MACIAIFNPSDSNAESMRELFGATLGFAMTAETACGLVGEAQHAKAWVDSYQSGFDPRRSDDGQLVVRYGALAHIYIAEHGAHSWCTEYMAHSSPW